MNNFNPTALEAAIMSAVKATGATSTIFATRPKSSERMNDFAVVSLASRIKDVAAYGTCEVEVSLFARNIENGKNAVKLGKMYDKLIASMPSQTGKYLIDPNPEILADAPDNYGFTARILLFKITIKHS